MSAAVNLTHKQMVEAAYRILRADQADKRDKLPRWMLERNLGDKLEEMGLDLMETSVDLKAIMDEAADIVGV